MTANWKILFLIKQIRAFIFGFIFTTKILILTFITGHIALNQLVSATATALNQSANIF